MLKLIRPFGGFNVNQIALNLPLSQPSFRRGRARDEAEPGASDLRTCRLHVPDEGALEMTGCCVAQTGFVCAREGREEKKKIILTKTKHS